MTIQYIRGDLMLSPHQYILHGCNAQGVMKSGIAKIIRERCPQVFVDYKSYEKEYGLNLGDIIPTEDDHHIYLSAITQEFYGRVPNTKYVSYDAIDKVFSSLNELDISEIAMPLIGAGLAQGHWPVIVEIIEHRSTNFDSFVYLLDGIIPT